MPLFIKVVTKFHEDILKRRNEMKNNVIRLNSEEDNLLNERMLRAKELSKIFVGTAQSTYDNWVRDGLLCRYKIGGGVYYKLSEVKSLIEHSRVEKEVG